MIITSLDVADDAGAPCLALVGSTTAPQAAGFPSRFRLRLAKLDRYFTGAGDLTAALLLANLARAPDRTAEAAASAVAAVQGVLRRTKEAADAPGAKQGPEGGELRLIQSAEEILRPSTAVAFEPLA